MTQFIRSLSRSRRAETVETRLRAYFNLINTVISLGFFGFILSHKLQLASYFSSDDVRALLDPEFLDRFALFLSERWFSAVVGLFVAFWFFRYKKAVGDELELLARLYTEDRTPPNWEKIANNRWVPLLAVGILAAFIGLAWSIDDFELFAAIMLILWTQDALGNNTLRRNILQHFYDPAYAPEPEAPLRDIILERRKVALGYWVWRPQIERIGVMISVTAFALVMNNVDASLGINIPERAPFVILLGTILVNEYLMFRWRRDRDRALEELEARKRDRLLATLDSGGS